MDARTKASVLWGAVGALAFLVLVQGYQLATDASVTIAPMFGVALLVGSGATGLTYAVHPRLYRR